MMELMVSVAILLAVLTLVGVIFQTVSKAGGNATASTTLHRQLSQVADIIKQDLEYTPTSSVMGIAGQIIPAHETTLQQSQGAAKTYHRADMLMLFSNRQSEPYLFDAEINGVTMAGTYQVTYGHADVGTILPATGQIDTATIRRLDDPVSTVVASEWQLARRLVHFVDSGTIAYPSGAVTDSFRLTDIRYLTGEADTLGFENWTAFQTRLPFQALLHYPAYGAVPNPPYPEYLTDAATGGAYLIDSSGAQFLFDSDGYWYKWTGTQWRRSDESGTHNPQGTPPGRAYPPPWQEWLFVNIDPNTLIRRTVIDPEPPLEVNKPVAAHFLPSCSEFKVEYTYDDPRQLDYDASTGDVNLTPRPIRWLSVGNGEQIIWSNLSVVPADRSDPRRWPRAVRITIRAWDSGGRLTEPVTRTIVHVFG